MPKLKMTTKKFIILFSIILVLSIALGVTLATVVKNLEKRANTFTFGNLSIDLTEPGWDELDSDDKITYPGRVITKDPRVKNTGETDAYLYIEVSVPRDTVQIVGSNKTTIGAASKQDLFTYTVNSGWTKIGSGTVSSDGAYTVYVYAYTASVVAPGASTPTLFDKVTFVNMLEGSPEMDEKYEILISATGIQAEYLNETGATLKDKIINAYTIAKSQAE